MTVAEVLGKKHRFQQHRRHNHRNKWYSCTDLLTLLELSLATAEQMRLAQMIFDKNDSDFEAKVKQLMEVTGKNPDECIVALHDCNGDVNKAINILLEGNSDTTSWETVGGKKKNFGKESSENREKKIERDASRGRVNNIRKGRGGNRGREYFRGEENGIDSNQGDKPSDRGKRARNKGFGRGRGRGMGRFSAQSMGTFNPADYSDSTSTDGCGTKLVVWEATQNGAEEGPDAWKNSVEEWPTEDWNEDLSETKVFTASSVPAENHVTPTQSIDLVSLLQKPVPPSQASDVNSFETSQQQGFGQALIFTNSQHNNQMAPGTGSSTAANSYSPHSLSSVLGSGFGELAPSKMANITNSQILDHLKAPSLGQFATTLNSQQNNTSPPKTTTSWDLKPSASQASVLSHFDFKSQPEPSPVLSQMNQRQQHQTQAVSISTPGLESFASQSKHRESAPGDSISAMNKLLQLPNMAVENIAVSAHQPQLKHIKLPKRRMPPASKNPATAVEMPGSADVTGLNVQFGALEFGSEPSLCEFGSAPCCENSNQIPISLYSKSLRMGMAVVEISRQQTHNSMESAPSLQSSAAFSPAATSTSSTPPSGVSLPGSISTASSLSLGGTTVNTVSSNTRAAPLVTSGKPPPNLPQGVPPLLHNQYLMGPGGLLPAYPVSARWNSWPAPAPLASGAGTWQDLIYGYDELQMLQSRLPMDYYGIPFAAPTALASRDGSLTNNPYSGDVTKFGRGDSASPAPPTTLAQPQQSQSQTHHTAQQPFLNPALPPGYSYTSLPYYTGVPSAFQYGPTMFVPPASAKQHGVNLSTPTTPFQQASGYGQHSYSTGYDDLTQGTAAGDYTKGGYGGSSQAPNKSTGSGPGKGVSVSSSTTGLPDMTGSVYKTQTFDKQGFHAGTPPPFSLPSALGSTGPLAPGAAPGYAPPPFLHILPAHQQPHSQLLHHHLPQDTQSGSGQRSQPSSLQPKSQASKPTYGNSPYWTN
ncbi:ubiquitin-associated protein 2 isoform X7 [Marmota flaviventris]|uniref:ubiquitin-associated protein 2 isoform X7 n=1 Tax=Marmota flaviventris TaxID=93162 RepID=UPI003A84D2BC